MHMDLALEEARGESRRRLGLHIDVLFGGAKIAEEVFFDRRTITVGWSTKNTVVLPDDLAPRSLPLFHRHDDGYTLHYTDEMQGQVLRQQGGSPLDLAETRFFSSEARDGAYDLNLREGAQGSIEVGEETLVFEVVADPDPVTVRYRHRWRTGLIAILFAALTLLAGRVWLVPLLVTSTPTGDAIAAPQPPSPGVDPSATGGPADVGGYEEARMSAAAVVGELSRISHEQLLESTPDLRGDLLVRVVLDGKGVVTDVSVVRDELDAKDVTNRILEALLGWRAPLPVEGPAVYEIPLHFNPAP